MVWLDHMTSHHDDPPWTATGSDIQYLMEAYPYEVDWLGDVKVTVVEDDSKLPKALYRLR